MFICEFCGKTVERCVKPIQVVTKTRQKVYHPSESIGWEIVEQRDACQSCVDNKQAISVAPIKSEIKKKKREKKDIDTDEFGNREQNRKEQKDVRRNRHS